MPLPDSIITCEDSLVNPSDPLCTRFQSLFTAPANFCAFREWAFNEAGSAATAEFVAMFIPTGSVFHLAGNSVPAGFLACNGQVVSRTTYAALFAVVGVLYGAGDGVSTFAVPDMGAKFAMGSDGSNAVATTGGAASVTLAVTEIPANLTVAITNPTSGTTLADSRLLGRSLLGDNAIDVDSNAPTVLYMSEVNVKVGGGGLAHENRPPFMSLLAIIKT